MKSVQYKGLIFNVESSGMPHQGKNKNIHACIYYAPSKKVKCIRTEAGDIDTLNDRIQNKVLPAMYKRAVDWERQRSSDGASAEITLPLFWAVWRNSIKDNNNWSDETYKKYAQEIDKAFEKLPDVPLQNLTLENIIEAANLTVFGTALIDGKTQTLSKRYKRLLTNISLIFDQAVFGGYFSHNPISKFAEQIKTPTSDVSIISRAFGKHNLGTDAEKQIFSIICNGLQKNGLLMGTALMLFTGISAEEACALQFKDITATSWIGETVNVLAISKAYRKQGGKVKFDDLLPEPTSYRLIPMHHQLESLYLQYRDITEKRLKQTTSKDLENVFLVRQGERIKGGCAPEQLETTNRKIMHEAGVKQIEAIPLPQDRPVSIPMYYNTLLRKNFEFHLEDGIGFSIDEINNLLGRGLTSTDSQHYRDWASEACLLNLKRKIDRWHIANEDECPIVESKNGEDHTITCVDTGSNSISLLLHCIPAESGHCTITIRSKKGSDIACSLIVNEK